jgi:hypothetical protein
VHASMCIGKIIHKLVKTIVLGTHSIMMHFHVTTVSLLPAATIMEFHPPNEITIEFIEFLKKNTT